MSDVDVSVQEASWNVNVQEDQILVRPSILPKDVGAISEPSGATAGDALVYDGADWVPNADAYVTHAGGIASFEANTRANQPAAGTADRYFFVTDELVLERDNGAAWEQIVDLAHRNDTANPHSVTHTQVGAPTGNPHGVTAAEAGAVENVGSAPSLQADTRANQPAAGVAGRLFHVIDEDVIERDNGTAWVQVVDLSHRNDATNPHSVTHAQVGAPATNPHAVTHGQVGAEREHTENVLDHGAVGDGVADDTAAVQAAIDAAGIAYFPGGTYRLTATLNLHGDLTLRLAPDAVIDASDLGINTPWADVSGTTSDPTALTQDANKGDIKIFIANGNETPFSPGDAVLIRSDRQPDLNQPMDGEIHFIDAVTAGSDTSDSEIQLEGGLWDAYATADLATVERVNAVRNITVEGDGRIVGAGVDDTKGAFFEFCQDVQFRGVTFEDFADNNIQLISCIVVDVTDCSIYWANQDGRGYGVMCLNATQWVNITGGNTFIDNRHGVSGGGFSARYGRPRHVVVDGNNFYGGRDSGVDSHSPGQFWQITNNVIEVGGFETDNSIDGVAWQGTDVTIANNTIINPQRHGVMVQTLRAGDEISNLVIEGNTILNPRSVGILVDIASDNMTLSGLVIADNSLDGATGVSIYVRANATGAVLENFAIGNNVITDAASVGLWLRAETGVVRWGTVGNNRVEVLNADEAIYLYTPTAGNLSRVAINGNVSNGGTHGIRGVNQADCFVDGNIALGSTAGIDGFAADELGSNKTT